MSRASDFGSPETALAPRRSAIVRAGDSSRTRITQALALSGSGEAREAIEERMRMSRSGESRSASGGRSAMTASAPVEAAESRPGIRAGSSQASVTRRPGSFQRSSATVSSTSVAPDQGGEMIGAITRIPGAPEAPGASRGGSAQSAGEAARPRPQRIPQRAGIAKETGAEVMAGARKEGLTEDVRINVIPGFPGGSGLRAP